MGTRWEKIEFYAEGHSWCCRNSDNYGRHLDGRPFHRVEIALSVYICEVIKSTVTLLHLILQILRCLSLNTSKSVGAEGYSWRRGTRALSRRSPNLLWGMGYTMCIFQVHRVCYWLFVCLSV